MHASAPHVSSHALEQCVRELRACLGDDAVLTRQSDLLAYDGDAYPMARQTPAAVALPSATEQIAAAVRICGRYGVPFVPRGAGTGLSGGATPLPDGVVISTARLNHILEIDLPNRRAVVEAGCINLAITNAVAHHGLHYAPDPSSQGVCTIGGNIAENAGGPHTLKYGVTVNHVTGVTLVLPSGEITRLGGKPEDPPGLDLVGILVGSEGTFGIVAEAIVKLTPTPDAYRTLLAVFDDVGSCTEAVVKVIASGVVPCALEMIDRTILAAIEDAFHFGFPKQAAAVLTIELDGAEAGLDDEADIVRSMCTACGAREIRTASTAEDRARLWIARKKGVGTAGRLAPSIVTQDGAIPRSKLPEVLAAVAECASKHGIRVCNIFHAGDGNLHPCVLFDQGDPDEAERVHRFNEDVLALCVAAGGTITGEHGVGIEKRDAMRLMFSPADLDWMARLRSAFDPDDRCNPGKLIPIFDETPEELPAVATPASRLSPPAPELAETYCVGGRIPDAVFEPATEAECRQWLLDARNRHIGVIPWGAGTLMHLGGPVLSSQWHVLRTARLNAIGPVSPEDSLITCAAGVPFAEVQRALAPTGHWVPLDPPDADHATVGGVVAANATGLLQCSHGTPRDLVVAVRAITSDGREVRAGARVVKNAAGYDLPRLLAGSMGTLALITEVTFRTRPIPAVTGHLAWIGEPAAICQAAWRLFESRLPLQHVGVHLSERAATPSAFTGEVTGGGAVLSVGFAGCRAASEWQRDQAAHIAEQAGLAAMEVQDAKLSEVPEMLRRSLYALDACAAVRLSAGPADAYALLRLVADLGARCTWIPHSGIVVLSVEHEKDPSIARVADALRGVDATEVWVRPLRPHPDWEAPIAALRRQMPAGDLAARIRRALDPTSTFSPGRSA
jgi:glycolate oxidase subunit GlcD